jgi:hypothetical protein
MTARKPIRLCDCGGAATNRKGPPVCDPCRAERVRLAQLRYHDKKRGTYQRGWDEPGCVWCGDSLQPRPYEVLRPKRFCSDRCRGKYGNEQRRARVRRERRCECGALPINKTGIPHCAGCKEAKLARRRRAVNLRPYGISVAEYDRLLEAQRGRCAVCGTKDPGSRRLVFAVDHCHETDQVRGLLCYLCNSGIGMLQDNPQIIRAAAEYVTRNLQLKLVI